MRRSLTLLMVPVVALLAAADANAFEAHGSVEQVYATGLTGGQKATLVDRGGRKVESRPATAEGGVVFRAVKPGKGYRVKSGGQKSGPLTVLKVKGAPPNKSIYNQSIPSSGYGYLTTRDGTELAYTVHPPANISDLIPGAPEIPNTGQTPTLIEYSGYGTANPSGPESGISLIANFLGFTVVDVNIRGTGCSGGSFDFFEPLQGLDGYDVIETIARQPWVRGGKVGMMGISYGGISQLFTAQYRPPSLAAITPLSVIDNTQTTLYPGGILNTGFAYGWALDRVHDALPAGPDAGQPWAWERIQNGDTTCAENQALHGDAVNLLQKIRENDHYVKKVADPLAPLTFVDEIKAPTFLVCQWQDEQTGGHCPTLASNFSGTKKKWFTFTNGTHIDALDPATFNRWLDFLYLYVAKDSPKIAGQIAHIAASVVYQQAMGVSGVTLPPDPIQEQSTYEGALAEFNKLQQVRVLFDNGAGSAPGKPVPGYERSFKELPVPKTKAKSWYLAPNGAMKSKRTGGKHADGFSWDQGAVPVTDFTGNTGAGGLWGETPNYNWVQNPEGTAVSYISGALAKDTTVVGAGFVKFWLRSSKRNADLQVTVSEVRPDGKETFVQGGWLRGSARKLDKKKSEPLAPVLSMREKDLQPLPKDRFVPATIPLYYQGHGYRAGSRIKVTISAPGGAQPSWAFEKARPKGGSAEIAIAYGSNRPSKLTLPVVGVGDIPTELPPCPGLRGQPCRDYQLVPNASAKP